MAISDQLFSYYNINSIKVENVTKIAELSELLDEWRKNGSELDG